MGKANDSRTHEALARSLLSCIASLLNKPDDEEGLSLASRILEGIGQHLPPTQPGKSHKAEEVVLFFEGLLLDVMCKRLQVASKNTDIDPSLS